MTAEQIEFDRERAIQYDLDIRKAIPGYDALHDMAQSLLETNLATTANVLVVGSGTGRELINYSQQNPSWSLTGVDPSDEMMNLARQELVRQNLLARVNLHTGYVHDLPQTELMDAATLILVMHFLPDDGTKLQILKDIATHLKQGAELVIADLHGDRLIPDFKTMMEAWKYLYFSQLDQAALIKAQQNFAASINNFIHFVTEARMRELLNSAGFTQVTKFYHAFLFGGWLAKYTGN